MKVTTYFLLVSLLIMSSLSLSAQKQVKIKTKKQYTSESGLKYTFYIYNSKAVKADSGDQVSVHYVGKLADGTIFDQSYARQMPITFALGKGQVIKGWEEGIALMHEGDSAYFEIPANLAYGERDMGTIKPNSTLFFTVKLVKLKSAFKPYNVAKLDTIKGAEGLRYIIVAKGSGPAAQRNDKVTAHYSGYFTDGRVFDSSFDTDQPFEFTIGRKRVIKGWDLAFEGMMVGEKRRLLIPYSLGYGEAGRAPIPPKSDLIFDVELLTIEKVNYPDFSTLGKDTLSLPNGVKYIMLDSIAKGTPVHPFDTVGIEYMAMFEDGYVFDASYDRNDLLYFTVASGNVIKGLDQSLLLFKEGDRFQLLIPYELAYGEAGRNPIVPPKANLKFNIVIKKVKKGKSGL